MFTDNQFRLSRVGQLEYIRDCEVDGIGGWFNHGDVDVVGDECRCVCGCTSGRGLKLWYVYAFIIRIQPCEPAASHSYMHHVPPASPKECTAK